MKPDIVEYVIKRVRENYSDVEIHGASLESILTATMAFYASRLIYEVLEAERKGGKQNET